ncbi:MAG: outer membrane beta-barrel domain-containing protein [Bdellovibrionales bacterium]
MKIQIAILCTVMMCGGSIFAQSNQYKRKAAPKASANKASKKVDIKAIQEKYWATDSKEFKVVQNRKYKKEKRINFSVMGGVSINDSFNDVSLLSLSGGYYFNEYHGIEGRIEIYDNSLSDASDSVIDQGGFPDINYLENFVGVYYNWIPFYGKLSLLDNKIVYFDMSISPGIGLMQVEQQSSTTNGRSLTVPAIGFDVTQQFFLNNNWSIRVDYRNKFYQEERISYSSGTNLGTKTKFNSYLLFGVTYYH